MTRLPLLIPALLVAGCARAPALEDLERAGASALQQGNLVAAEGHVAAGSRLAVARGDAERQRRFRLLQVEVLIEQRRYTDALDLLRTVTAAADEAGPVGVRILSARGRARCLSGAAEAIVPAVRDLEEAARLASALPSAELTGEVARHRGNCAWAQRDFAAAEVHYRAALAVAQEHGLPILEAKAVGSLGLIRIQTRRFDDAVSWLERALALATTLKTDLVAVKTLTNLGYCHHMLGDYERALPLLAQAEALADRHGLAGERQLALQMAGNARYRLGDRGRAAADFRRSLAIARELGDEKRAGELLGNLAIVAVDEGHADAAAAFVAEALQIKTRMGDHAAIPHSLLTQARIRAMRGEHATAEALYAGVLGSPHADRELQWETRAALASLRMTLGQPVAAESEFRHAFAIIEDSRSELRQAEHKISFFSSLDQFHDAYVDFLVSRGETRRALEVADRSRARLLRESVEADRSSPYATAAQFQQAARSLDAVILFYWLAPSRSFLWEVSPRDVRLHVLPGEQTIADRVEAHQRLVLRSRDPLAEGAPDAAWLYETLVGPVRTAVPPGSRVLFVPDGALHQVNPETLIVSRQVPHYWIEDVTVLIAPSLSVLARGEVAPRPVSARARAILIIGDPLPAGDEFPKLSHAAREVRGIAEQFAPSEQEVYSGGRANRGAYLQSNPAAFSFIHFAAHANANHEVPLESAVILSPGEDSAKLYARDILGIPIRAELVTISACRGAGSRAYAGEGLVGLTWAFLSSGAGSVIAGLWNVDDASTSELMEDLYAGLTQGQPAAEALRQAKLKLLQSSTAYRKPFYWAPFVTYTRGSTRAALPRTIAREHGSS